MRVGLVSLLLSTSLSMIGLAAGCGEDIALLNQPSSVVFDRLEADGAVLDVYYRALDREGDDLDIDILVCLGDACVVPTSAPGGDGTRNLPTLAGEPVLHLFRWAAGCDVDEATFDQERVIQITPHDGKVGPVVRSGPFSLSDLGVVTGCGQDR